MMQIAKSLWFTKARTINFAHFCTKFAEADMMQMQTETHSRMGHYFFSYLVTREVDVIEILDIIP